jgi:hypothetical protein
MHTEEGRETAALLQTLPREIEILRTLPDQLDRFRELRSHTLLLIGEKSPAFLRQVAPALKPLVPLLNVIEMAGTGHNAPDIQAPAAVAEHLLRFFAG